MVNLLLLLIIPVVISSIVLWYFRGEVTLGEFFMQIGAIVFVLTLGLGTCYWNSTSDTELLNGQVESKERLRVSCSHSYSCNCYTTTSTDSQGHTTTTEHCSTCYEHSYDVEWKVNSNIGESLYIDTVDRQGIVMPPRWGEVFVGQPYSAEHTYTNYILANPDSVLLGTKGDLERFGKQVPDYPRVHDYYKADHFINVGVPNIDFTTWNWLMNEKAKVLGPIKKVNPILITVNTADPTYAYAFRDKWVGGKKNDAVILIGSTDGNTIRWVDVVSWTPEKIYNIKLRDRILALGSLHKRDDIVHAIQEETTRSFVKMEMSNYKYLTANFQPSSTSMIVLFFLGLALSGGLSFWSITNDITEDRRNYGAY